MGAVGESKIASDLRDLTQAIDEGGIPAERGFLGGEYAYGAEFENDVFEMHPYWWDDCTCGHEQREIEWAKANDHENGCYQFALRNSGITTEPTYDGPFTYREPRIAWNDPRRDSIIEALCAQYCVDPKGGSMVHCTCSRDARQARWAADNPHPKSCPLIRPNFRHKSSGVEVVWYKYIGRSMEVSPTTPERKIWVGIMNECLQSLEK